MSKEPTLTLAEIDELLRLEREAFREPWTYSNWEVECPCDSEGDCSNKECDGSHVPCTTLESPDEYPDGQVVAQFQVPGLSCLADKNGALIVALRNHAKALLALASEALAMRWIPCSERMPEPGVTVDFAISIALAGTAVACGHWDESEWVDEQTDAQNDHIRWAPGEVAHWRNRPDRKAHPPVPAAAQPQPKGNDDVRTGPSDGDVRDGDAGLRGVSPSVQSVAPAPPKAPEPLPDVLPAGTRACYSSEPGLATLTAATVQRREGFWYVGQWRHDSDGRLSSSTASVPANHIDWSTYPPPAPNPPPEAPQSPEPVEQNGHCFVPAGDFWVICSNAGCGFRWPKHGDLAPMPTCQQSTDAAASDGPSDEELERVADTAEFASASAAVSYTETCRARERAERRALYTRGCSDSDARHEARERLLLGFVGWVNTQDGTNGYVWRGDLRRRIKDLEAELAKAAGGSK